MSYPKRSECASKVVGSETTATGPEAVPKRPAGIAFTWPVRALLINERFSDGGIVAATLRPPLATFRRGWGSEAGSAAVLPGVVGLEVVLAGARRFLAGLDFIGGGIEPVGLPLYARASGFVPLGTLPTSGKGDLSWLR